MLCCPDDPDYPEHIKLLEIVSDINGGIDFGSGKLEILIKESDLKFGNWKRTKAILKQSRSTVGDWIYIAMLT